MRREDGVGRGRGRWALVAAGALLMAGGVVVAVNGSTGDGPTITHPALVRRGAVPTSPPTDPPGKGFAAGLLPVRLAIPAIGVDAPVDDVTVGSKGALGVPLDPATVGWWSTGPLPGAAAGTAVLDSHINYAGRPGAFAQLDQLQPGDTIEVDGASASQAFVVTGLREYAKGQLPWASVFSGQVGGRLALVTCGGPFDSATGHYEDNIVAYAVPATS